MKTDQLIADLARDLHPVKPLRRPLVRAAGWLAAVVLFLGIVTFALTSPADAAANRVNVAFLLAQVLAAATGVAAAAAAFASVVPGYSRGVLVAPVLSAAVWLAVLAGASVQEWQGGVVSAGHREWLCVLMIVGGGAIPFAALRLMLREGAPLTPRLTAALGGLSVAALANVGACVSTPHPSSLVVLAWHGATIAAVATLAWAAGRAVLTPRDTAWRSSTP
jgi:hypothetical protein